jgi:DNA (cytosine-5)-methyltransferase 3A
MNVLSLFDGLSGGNIALNRLGVKVDNYFASEIDPYAIAVAKHNFPYIQHIGSVVDVDPDDLPHIDLLIGGSPCQGFSFAGKRKGSSTKTNLDVVSLDQYLDLKNQGFEFDGQSYLFWEYMRLLEALRIKNPDIKFMLENVVMSQKWRNMFDAAIGTDAININSNLVSAQNRKRLYWTNIQVDGQPEDKGILLYDILETKSDKQIDDKFRVCDIKFERVKPNVQENIKKHHKYILTTEKTTYIMPVDSDFSDNKVSLTKCITLRANNSCAYVLDRPNKTYRKLTVLECERLQTVPDNYTVAKYNGKPVSETQRYKMIGNGWTIDVICHLLKNLNKPIAVEPKSILF